MLPQTIFGMIFSMMFGFFFGYLGRKKAIKKETFSKEEFDILKEIANIILEFSETSESESIKPTEIVAGNNVNSSMKKFVPVKFRKKKREDNYLNDDYDENHDPRYHDPRFILKPVSPSQRVRRQ